MTLNHRSAQRVLRLGAHLLGSLGLTLALGGALSGCGASFLRWFPWEAAAIDRLSSLICGLSLMALGVVALTLTPRARPSDDS